MRAKVYNENKEVMREIELERGIFDLAPNPDLLHQALRILQLGQRKSTAHAKTRGEVSGGGRKPWQQKGTGRARHGSTRSPLWRKGGVTHGPRREKDYTLKLNKKMKQGAIKLALSLKAQQDLLYVLGRETKLSFEKTKSAKEFFDRFLKPGKKIQRAVLLCDFSEKKQSLGLRNLNYLHWLPVKSINLLDLLNYKYLILNEAGLAELTKFLNK